MRGPRAAMKNGPRLPQLEKALARNEDPTQPKINKVAINLKKKKKKNPCPGHVRVNRGTVLTDMAADVAAKSDSQPREVKKGEATLPHKSASS